ncbi:predicted protein [Candida tropicalis MYA-3404]|uniref:Uncharacterized protein n=1 Tax=Candida tropicalis (strain ATCC MYA-3404 / T1) TaxID=294747 RepID=C5MA19_CANTT|nr:predicted protein [Candida tropicalis MYA-3404]EER33513.1 predicted protein [Candida tropicalis MYA-3404]KAG4407351.1 hypothetical protein JTP64_002886 [Candida tropicalis]
MIAKLMGVTYLKSKFHRSSNTAHTNDVNLESTADAPFPKIKSSNTIESTSTIKRSKSTNPSSSTKGKQKKHSNSHEIVTRSQVRRSNTVPSGIALKNFSLNRTSGTSSSLPNSPSLHNGLSLIEEYGPPSRTSSQDSTANYNLTPNNSGSNLMSLQHGYLTVDYNVKDDSSSLYTGKSNNRPDDYYDSDYDSDKNENDYDSVTNLWVFPRTSNNFSIPRTHGTKKKNVRFM